MSHNTAGMVARAEEIVRLLRTCYVCEGWELDGKRADEFLENVRRLGIKGRGREARLTHIIAWVSDHGQSLDWLFRGNVGVMVCEAAARSFAPKSRRRIAA